MKTAQTPAAENE